MATCRCSCSPDPLARRDRSYGDVFSIMQGFMNQPLSNDELLSFGINIAWDPRPTHLVTYVALYDYVRDFMERGSAAFQDFRERHKDNPYVSGALRIGGAQVAKQRELEEDYFSKDALEKYQMSRGREGS